jgi:3-hydroxyacyl-CoA dehydrogenase / 3-hydroxy-2-methylbutyryl-CoA dehydrogenase
MHGRVVMILTDCVAIVTGGALGLGEATVRHLVKEGAKVAIFDIAAERGEKLSAELRDDVIFTNADVSNEKSVLTAINRTMDCFGKINVLINCAGISEAQKILSKKGPMSISHFNRVLQINLVGTVNVIRLGIQFMVENRPNMDGEKGVIINTASIAAFEGQVGQVAYSASKAAIVGMTLPLALECANYGVRVVTISPGVFDTPMFAGLPENVTESLKKMIPFPKRLGHPSEFSMLCLHIIGNPMLNGETIRLDGALRGGNK